jgi:hypothetical protein
MRRPADFGSRTFLERVSLAAREPVYSAAFAWALDDQSPLPLEQRLAVIAALSGADTKGGRAISATTEWYDVDLLLTVEREAGHLYVAIENKIKAVEGKKQLAVYDQHIDQLPETVKKVFLTLTGEVPRSGAGWLPVSYSVLVDALCAQPASDNPYVADLCGALARLVAVSDAARAETGVVAAAAFEDNDAPDGTDLSSYVEEMRLKKVVQRIWMTELAAGLGVTSPWQIGIGETHGQALLNVEAALQDTPGYLVGMQLQWRALKAFCMPYPYPTKANDDQHRTVEVILETIRAALGLGGNATPSARRPRGFRSFSIARLPPGRKRDEWIAVLKPQLTKLVAAFPFVQPVALGAVPIADDDE